MANIYVKLKEMYYKQKGAMAKDIYGTLVYPGEKQWTVFDESQLERLKKHRDFELLDVKTQDVIDAEKQDYKKEIEDISTGNWKRAEKLINQISDKQKLQDIKKYAIANDRKSVAKLVDARLEEMNF